MNLRRNVRVPRRFEDDDDYPDRFRGRSRTKPADPKLMAAQIVPFKLQPAKFPSLPLGGPRDLGESSRQRSEMSQPGVTVKERKGGDDRERVADCNVEEEPALSSLDEYRFQKEMESSPERRVSPYCERPIVWAELALALQLEIWSALRGTTDSFGAAARLELTPEERRAIESIHLQSRIHPFDEQNFYDELDHTYHTLVQTHNDPPTYGEVVGKTYQDFVIHGHLYYAYNYEVVKARKFLRQCRLHQCRLHEQLVRPFGVQDARGGIQNPMETTQVKDDAAPIEAHQYDFGFNPGILGKETICSTAVGQNDSDCNNVGFTKAEKVLFDQQLRNLQGCSIDVPAAKGNAAGPQESIPLKRSRSQTFPEQAPRFPTGLPNSDTDSVTVRNGSHVQIHGTVPGNLVQAQPTHSRNSQVQKEMANMTNHPSTIFSVFAGATQTSGPNRNHQRDARLTIGAGKNMQFSKELFPGNSNIVDELDQSAQDLDSKCFGDSTNHDQETSALQRLAIRPQKAAKDVGRNRMLQKKPSRIVILKIQKESGRAVLRNQKQRRPEEGDYAMEMLLDGQGQVLPGSSAPNTFTSTAMEPLSDHVAAHAGERESLHSGRWNQYKFLDHISAKTPTTLAVSGPLLTKLETAEKASEKPISIEVFTGPVTTERTTFPSLHHDTSRRFSYAVRPELTLKSLQATPMKPNAEATMYLDTPPYSPLTDPSRPVSDSPDVTMSDIEPLSGKRQLSQQKRVNDREFISPNILKSQPKRCASQIVSPRLPHLALQSTSQIQIHSGLTEGPLDQSDVLGLGSEDDPQSPNSAINRSLHRFRHHIDTNAAVTLPTAPQSPATLSPVPMPHNPTGGVLGALYEDANSKTYRVSSSDSQASTPASICSKAKSEVVQSIKNPRNRLAATLVTSKALKKRETVTLRGVKSMSGGEKPGSQNQGQTPNISLVSGETKQPVKKSKCEVIKMPKQSSLNQKVTKVRETGRSKRGPYKKTKGKMQGEVAESTVRTEADGGEKEENNNDVTRMNP